MKVGEYVRIKKYGIRKIEMVIDEPKKKGIRFDDIDGWNKGVPEEEIIKYSTNIIDLIEVGDYVNGYKVEKVEKVKNKELGKKVVLDTEFIIAYDYDTDYIYNKNIKSIVTKEQFESMEYKVKEEIICKKMK